MNMKQIGKNLDENIERAFKRHTNDKKIKEQIEKVYNQGYFGEPLEEDWQILEELKLKQLLKN